MRTWPHGDDEPASHHPIQWPARQKLKSAINCNAGPAAVNPTARLALTRAPHGQQHHTKPEVSTGLHTMAMPLSSTEAHFTSASLRIPLHCSPQEQNYVQFDLA